MAGHWRHRVWQLGVVVVAVFTATELRDASPKAETYTLSFPTSAAQGQPARLRGLDVTVTRVDGAETLAAAPYRRPTNGVWVVVTVRLHAVTAPARMGSAVLIDSAGRRYAASERFDQPMLRFDVQPGFDAEGPVAFEVPVEVVRELRFQGALEPTDTRLDRVTDIPLTVTDNDVRRWTGDGSELTFGPREVVT